MEAERFLSQAGVVSDRPESGIRALMMINSQKEDEICYRPANG